MRFSLFLFVLLLINDSFSQVVLNFENQDTGTIRLSKEVFVPEINSGYTLWLPDSGAIKGMIVFIHARRDTLSSDSIIDYALANSLAVLYATTNNRLEFFFDEEKLQEIEGYIHEVIVEHEIPDDNLLYCGMSLEGTRVLKLAIFGRSINSVYNIVPRAIAICDSPLDMVRFHRETIRAVEVNFSQIAVNEGSWVSQYLQSNLDGSPSQSIEKYIEYSPFCYMANGGHHLDKFENIAIRAYTEPDVNWWIEERRKDYYSMNAIDLAGFINALKINGKGDVELIITSNKGYRKNGDKHPHSWSIVDNKEMIDWFLAIDN